MQAASSPMMWTWGFRMVVWMGLLFLDSTGGEERGDRGEESGDRREEGGGEMTG